MRCLSQRIEVSFLLWHTIFKPKCRYKIVMIEYIKGEITELTPTQAVVEAGGVGYGLSISLNTYSSLQGQKGSVRVYVFESIREDAYQLYGFSTRQERMIFSLLIGISGVGGSTARMVLSAFTPADLARIVESEDIRSLKSVKGIGPKAAGRIIVELKDKVAAIYANAIPESEASSSPVALHSPIVEEAVQALAVLGFSPVSVQKVVMQIVKDDPTLPVESIIKKALKML